MTTLDQRTPRRHATHSGTPWAQARATARLAAEPLEAFPVPLERARGGVLAESLRARTAHPAFDTAAMDGYAVAGSAPWTVVGRVLAGRPSGVGALTDGQAVEIATGAAVPPGACAVLPYETALRTDGLVTGVVEARRHIRYRGEECAEGREVLPAGTPVTPAVLGLAAALGHDALTVHRRPRVAVLVTGDEVVRHGLPPAGQVRDALGPLLPGLVDWAGGTAQPTTYLPDGRSPLTTALARTGVDVIAVCGASSRGPADHLRPALRALGAELLVDGVACRPGHPQLLARLPGAGRLVVGLPGNPYAALAAALTLLVPALHRLAGRSPALPSRAALAGSPAPHAHDTRLVPVAVAGGRATPVGHDRPGLLWGAAAADALAVLPPAGAADPGDVRDVELLELPR
ncbi:molybdopterin molybdotransferase MoeA [Streptomyces sp. NPDC001070]